jgi:hypothetical protein
VPPPIAIEATVTVSRGAPPRFHAHGASAAFINSKGDMHFECFHHPIVVAFRLESPDVQFQGDGNESVSFADNATRDKLMALPPKHHQFPIGVQHLGRQRIWFVYNNDWDCGQGDNQPRCRTSAYGLNLVSTRHQVTHADPLIGNGGHGNY